LVRAILITGAPGSGKSTVAQALANLVPRGAHVPVDFFRKMVKGGYASPHHWTDEVTLQYKIARRSAAQTAVNLAEAGILPVLDDIVAEDWIEQWKQDLKPCETLFVLLDPPLGVCLQRNLYRETWTVEEQVIRDLHAMFRAPYTEKWLRLDSSLMEPSEAAQAILSSLGKN